YADVHFFLFLLYRSGRLRDLHSFPTRRSSDLFLTSFYADCVPLYVIDVKGKRVGLAHAGWRGTVLEIGPKLVRRFVQELGSSMRSEEHTSELQSRENLVCRLLLEKKNSQYKTR